MTNIPIRKFGFKLYFAPMNTLLRKLYGIARWVTGRDPLYPFRSLPHAHTILRGRHLTIFPDDVFLVSYPRSGNTWLRFLISNLLHSDPTTFANIETRIPDVYHHPDPALIQHPRPRILKSHEYLVPRYPRVIYIARDPRDVAISYYHWLRKIDLLPVDCLLSDYIPRFIAADFEPFGSWGDHLGGWIGARSDNPTFLLLRYEDLHSAPAKSLSRIADFLALPTTDALIDHAIQRSDASQMRALEHQQSDQWVTTQNTNPTIPFVRASSVGEWQHTLDPHSIAAIEQAWGAQMRLLRYL